MLPLANRNDEWFRLLPNYILRCLFWLFIVWALLMLVLPQPRFRVLRASLWCPGSSRRWLTRVDQWQRCLSSPRTWMLRTDVVDVARCWRSRDRRRADIDSVLRALTNSQRWTKYSLSTVLLTKTSAQIWPSNRSVIVKNVISARENVLNR